LEPDDRPLYSTTVSTFNSACLAFPRFHLAEGTAAGRIDAGLIGFVPAGMMISDRRMTGRWRFDFIFLPRFGKRIFVEISC
jgi:hypothetical protein